MQLNPSEHQIQAALFQWAAIQCKTPMPELALLYAIPNGGARHLLTGWKMKQEGLKPGVPDICLPVARKGFHGLYMELKSANGVISPEQGWWLENLNDQGYKVCVARTIDSAISQITNYLGH